jgi:hypothetical protein
MKRKGENKINGLHKDLRTRMFEKGLQAQMIDGMEMKQVKKFMEGVRELVGFSRLVLIEEEKSFFPGIISVAPFMIPLLEQEHTKVEELGERICVLADDFEEAYADSEKMNAIMLLQSAFYEWMAFTMQHLVREELIMKQAMTQESVQERVLSLVAA